MSTKAHERRVRQSQERTRVRLKERQIEIEAGERELERERLALKQERTETVALLQVLCEQYGSVDWDAQTPLPEVIEYHLMDPVMQAITKLLTRQAPPQLAPKAPPSPARAARAPEAPPRLLKPTAVPEIIHKVLVVAAQVREMRGRIARCTCGWASPLVTSDDVALQLGQEHAQGLAPGQPQDARRRASW